MSSCVSCRTPGIKKPHRPCRISDGQPCVPCIQMKELEGQIDESSSVIEKMIDSLKQQLARHRELRTQANHLHNPIILRAPPEIASSIFQFYVSGQISDAFAFYEHHKFAVPLTLGAVCRSWRQIAWSTPQLWNFISILFNPLKFPARCEAVREWLGRSGQLPLSIHIVDVNKYDLLPSDLYDLNPVIDVINGYSSRWYQLDLYIPSFFISRFVGDSQGVSIPILRKLRISANFRETEGRFSLKNVRPRPTYVTLDGLPLKSVDIEWNNVTDVKLTSFPVEECIELIRRTPQLLQYDLVDTLPPKRHFQRPENTIIHPLLRVLNFGSYDDFGSYDGYIEFFNSLTLPALEYFRCNRLGRRLEIDSLSSLFRRSTCPLIELVILDAGFTEVEINNLLRLTPSLHRLKLVPRGWQSYTPDSLFRLLASTSRISGSEVDSAPQDPFLPCLQSVNYTPVSEFSWNLVPDIFGPASEIGEPHRRPLRHLQISFDHVEETGNTTFPYIDEPGTIYRLLKLIDASISLEFGIMDDSNDLFKLSMVYHGMAEEDGSSATSDLWPII